MKPVNQDARRAKHPLYATWRGMIRRCEDPKAAGWVNYGGRGITVCEPWHDYKVFETWILENLGPRPDGMTLDRINNNRPYKPGNVRWATWAEQLRTRRPPLLEWKEWLAGWQEMP
jgi:hypothetical protein